MRCLESDSLDPFRNLALEECLLAQAARFGSVLMLYRNRECVVIGKNQNPWRECATGYLRRRGAPLVRRLSGGGAVYHDPGNLNYTLVMPRADYRAADCFARVRAALAACGIAAELTPHHSLTVDGRKISGTAFCFRGDAALHHGTLLVSAKLAEMRAALAPPALAIETRAIMSRPTPVINLTALDSRVTCARLQRELATAFECAGAPLTAADLAPANPDAAAERFAAWEWQFGATPVFRVVFQPAPERKLALEIEAGRCADVRCDDAEVPRRLAGCRFVAEDLAQCLAGAGFWHIFFAEQDF